MRKVLILACLFYSPLSWAHFQMIIAPSDVIKQGQSKSQITIKFWHPFEGHGMAMQKPKTFGVLLRGARKNLLAQLKAKQFIDVNNKSFSGYTLDYRFARPGDHTFYIEPQPYWEESEKRFIIHFSKVIINAYGLQQGWDDKVGFPVEILPYTRPYGLYVGNSFSAQVLKKGRLLKHAEVEVEYYQSKKLQAAPTDAHVTQVVKTNARGEFTFTLNKAGWWGFAALTEADKKRKHNGKLYPVEWGAVMWIKAW